MKKSVHKKSFSFLLLLATVLISSFAYAGEKHNHDLNDDINYYGHYYFNTNVPCAECGKSSPLVTCTNCNGTGKNGGSTCGNCKGSGKLHDECDHAYVPPPPPVEVSFMNPVLISGTDKQDGAIYKFSNVAANVDATIKIKGRSHTNVIIEDFDVTEAGWNKAFQPQVGMAGGIPDGTTLWAEFEVTFYNAGTNDKKRLRKFVVTALDVDGDGVSVKEFVQMDNADSVKYSNATYLSQTTALPATSGSSDDGYNDINAQGTSILSQGPVNNFAMIDTSATQVMATYTYLNKSGIRFRVGSKKGAGNAGARIGTDNMIGARTGGAGTDPLMSNDPNLRLNSLWFKTFNLAPMTVLPVTTTTFTATYNKKDVLLKWTTQSEKDFSHFEVERSTDGKQYGQIALVFAGDGSDGIKAYSFKDANVATPSGVLYYRLRQVDKTAEATFSTVRVIRIGKEEMETIALSTYPNPVTDQLKVSLPNAWQSKPVVVELYNSIGALVQSIKISSASQTETLQMHSVAKGFYLVKAVCEKVTAQQTVIKN